MEHDPEGWLEVDPKTGLVQTRAQLDRESPQVENNIYTAKVIAFDRGRPSLTSPLVNSLDIALQLLLSELTANQENVSKLHFISCLSSALLPLQVILQQQGVQL